MKVAIVHDWLVTYAGAERVLEQMLASFPQAEVFSLVDFMPPEQRMFLGDRKVTTSFIQHLPGARKHYRNYLPLMPLAVEQLDMSGYDLIISSSHAVAKGVMVGPDQLHICMCYSPIRYAWDMQTQYLIESGLSSGLKAWLARWMLHKIRLWDVRTAHGVDQFIAISHFISRRIQKSYRRDSIVIYPPVDVNAFETTTKKEEFYLTTSRMVPYKKIPLIVKAFSEMTDKKLIVIGAGPDYDKTKALAGSNVQLLGHQPAVALKNYLSKAKAFIFAAEEDFGIAPLEAQASGTPVIAFGKGGALETIRGLQHAQPTGIFFHEQTTDALIRAIEEFEINVQRITPQACRANALRFSQERFRYEFSHLINSKYQEFLKSKKAGTD